MPLSHQPNWEHAFSVTLSFAQKITLGFVQTRLAPCMNSRDERLFQEKLFLGLEKLPFQAIQHEWPQRPGFFYLNIQKQVVFQSDMLFKLSRKIKVIEQYIQVSFQYKFLILRYAALNHFHVSFTKAIKYYMTTYKLKSDILGKDVELF